MKHATGITATLVAISALVVASPASGEDTDKLPCRYAPNITVMQDEWATVELGDTFREVRDKVGGAGFAYDDDPAYWRRTYHTCARDGFVETRFHRVPGQGLILFGSSIKWQ